MSQFKHYRTNKVSGWKILGSGGGGACFTPVVSPHDSNTIMCTSDMTGTYISHNSGKMWEVVNLKSRTDALAFDPNSSKTIYAGSSGLYRSEDNGDNWHLVFPDPEKVTSERFKGDEALHFFVTEDNWPGGKIKQIAVDPSDSQKIYVCIGLGESIHYDADELEIYYSEDYGRTFKSLSKFDGAFMTTMFIDPNSPEDSRMMYAITDVGFYEISLKNNIVNKIDLPPRFDKITVSSCGVNPDTGMVVFYAVTKTTLDLDNKIMHTGVMRSVDFGRSWTELNGGLDADFDGYDCEQSRYFRAMDASAYDARVVYISVYRVPGDITPDIGKMNYFGIMKTVDMGETWCWCEKSGLDHSENMEKGWMELFHDPNWMGAPISIGTSPNEPDVCFTTWMGSTCITRDGGKTWQQTYGDLYEDGSSFGRNHAVTGAHNVCFDPYDKDHLVVPYTDIGMNQSFNGGKSWTDGKKGVPYSWTNTSYNMIFEPEIKGRAWSIWSGLHDLPRTKNFKNNYPLKTKTYKGGFCRSDDGCRTWQVSNTGLPETSKGTSFVMDMNSPVENRTFYMSSFYHGVYKSTDDGRTWISKSNGLPEECRAYQLRLLPDGTLFLIICRSLIEDEDGYGSVYKSVDGAESWELVDLPAGVTGPNDLQFDPTNPDRLYLSCWPTLDEVKKRFGGIYMSEDCGKTWSKIFDKAMYVFAVTVDEKNPDTMFATTFENTLYRTDDKGRTWYELTGFDFRWAHRVVIDIYNRDMIYVCTFGNSVWYGPAKGS